MAVSWIGIQISTFSQKLLWFHAVWISAKLWSIYCVFFHLFATWTAASYPVRSEWILPLVSDFWGCVLHCVDPCANSAHSIKLSYQKFNGGLVSQHRLHGWELSTFQMEYIRFQLRACYLWGLLEKKGSARACKGVRVLGTSIKRNMYNKNI